MLLLSPFRQPSDTLMEQNKCLRGSDQKKVEEHLHYFAKNDSYGLVTCRHYLCMQVSVARATHYTVFQGACASALQCTIEKSFLKYSNSVSIYYIFLLFIPLLCSVNTNCMSTSLQHLDKLTSHNLGTSLKLLALCSSFWLWQEKSCNKTSNIIIYIHTQATREVLVFFFFHLASDLGQTL